MKLVVDANVVFSFFKKDSTARELILDPELKYSLELFAPKFMLEEVGKHKNEICSKFGISSKNFEVMFSSLPLFIRLVKKDLFRDFLSKAEKTLSQHIKDVPYAALSFSFRERGYEIGIWSNEKRLKVLERYGIKIFSTSDLKKQLVK